MKRTFEEDLDRAVSFHGHVCGGQMTGVRMARYALRYFGIEDADSYRDLIVYVECDRCLTDAIMVVTGCHPGKRRMKCLDFGKQAATFYDLNKDEAIRLVNVSEKCPKDADLHEWFAKRSDEDLFDIQHVRVNYSANDAPGRPHSHATCAVCGEDITDGREINTGRGKVICKSCAGQSYYEIL